MKARIVIGSNYGDEGKGTVVASYTKRSENVLNVLTNGGAQRGHSILTKDGSITFQHFGSGTYHGADSYYSRYFILNPMQFVREYESLIVKPEHIYRDASCLWSTPYDSMANLIAEQQKGRHASCCMGIWNTILRYKKMATMTFNDFLRGESAPYYLAFVKRYYERTMTVPARWKATWESPGIADHFIGDCKFMAEHTTVCDLSSLAYDNLIFENGQGLLLCDTGKDTFDTTPSNTGIEYSLDLLKDLKVNDVTAHYVTRPYLTRHGDGHIQNGTSRQSLSSAIAPDRTNWTNTNQGEFRYGILEIPELRERVERDARGVRFELEVTHCDEMDRLVEFRRHFGKVNAYDNPMT